MPISFPVELAEPGLSVTLYRDQRDISVLDFRSSVNERPVAFMNAGA